MTLLMKKLRTSEQRDVSECRQTDCVTLKEALFDVIAYWKNKVWQLRAAQEFLTQYAVADKTVCSQDSLTICLNLSADKEKFIDWDCLLTIILTELCRQDLPITAPSFNHWWDWEILSRKDMSNCRQAKTFNLRCSYFHSFDVSERMKSNT